MWAKSALVLAICICYARGACETEDDLDFDACDLQDLKDDVLKDICNRIGLDMENHVLPFLFEEEGDATEDGVDPPPPTRTYTHEDFVKGAEECLLIEDEMNQLEEDDPDYLAQLEREALEDDPEIVAEIVADILKQDHTLLHEMTTKLTKDAPEKVEQVQGMLGEGEKLEDRPDVVGYIVAELLSEDQDLALLDEIDAALSEHMEEHWGDEEEGIGEGIGDGDEL
ncbi:hypothetical protein ACHAXT_011612 [Thalassiosira profunda]